MILTIKENDVEKNYTFIATMKKIVTMNKKYKVKNFRDTFFRGLNNVDFEFLGEVLLTLADDETRKILNGDSNKVFDLIESYVSQNNTDYEAIYKMVAEEINDKSFFGKKMTKEEMEAQMNNPLADFDINEVMNRTAEKVIGEIATEEFKGYKG